MWIKKPVAIRLNDYRSQQEYAAGVFFVFQSGIIRHCSKHLQDNLLQNSKTKQKSSPSEYYATQPVLLPLPVAVVAAYLEVQMGSYVRYQMLEYLGYFQM